MADPPDADARSPLGSVYELLVLQKDGTPLDACSSYDASLPLHEWLPTHFQHIKTRFPDRRDGIDETRARVYDLGGGFLPDEWFSALKRGHYAPAREPCCAENHVPDVQRWDFHTLDLFSAFGARRLKPGEREAIDHLEYFDLDACLAWILFHRLERVRGKRGQRKMKGWLPSDFTDARKSLLTQQSLPAPRTLRGACLSINAHLADHKSSIRLRLGQRGLPQVGEDDGQPEPTQADDSFLAEGSDMGEQSSPSPSLLSLATGVTPMSDASDSSKRQRSQGLRRESGPSAKRRQGNDGHVLSASTSMQRSDNDDGDNHNHHAAPACRLVPHNAQSLARIRQTDGWLDDDVIAHSLAIFLAASESPAVHVAHLCDVPTILARTQAKVLLSVLENGNHWTLVVIPEDRHGALVYNSRDDDDVVKSTIDQAYGREVDTADVSYTTPVEQRDGASCGLVLILVSLCEVLGLPVPQGQMHVETWRASIHLLLAPLTKEEEAAVESLRWDKVDSAAATSPHLEYDPAGDALAQPLRRFLSDPDSLRDELANMTRPTRRLLPCQATFRQLRDQAHAQHGRLGQGDRRPSRRESAHVLEATVRINRLIRHLEARSRSMEKAREMLKMLDALRSLPKDKLLE